MNTVSGEKGRERKGREGRRVNVKKERGRKRRGDRGRMDRREVIEVEEKRKKRGRKGRRGRKEQARRVSGRRTEASIYYTPRVYARAVVGRVYPARTARRQTDRKRIVAYASVSLFVYDIDHILLQSP